MKLHCLKLSQELAALHTPFIASCQLLISYLLYTPHSALYSHSHSIPYSRRRRSLLQLSGKSNKLFTNNSQKDKMKRLLLLLLLLLLLHVPGAERLREKKTSDPSCYLLHLLLLLPVWAPARVAAFRFFLFLFF